MEVMKRMKYLLGVIDHGKRSQSFLRSLLALTNKKPLQWQHNLPTTKSQETDLVKQLKSRIKVAGPITVADYMKEVLSNPLLGYYMNKDVLGVHGDFITSPEISQMFGEMIGIWFYDHWLQCGSPHNLQLVELGPGRGTLMSDILRVFTKLGKISESLRIHLVEISPAMKKMQQTLLCESTPDHQGSKQKETVENVQCITKSRIPITWHNDIFDVPKGLSFYLAHEFFDVLPIHQFQNTKHGWREVMVDIDDNDGPHHLKFCLAPGRTPATVLIPAQTKGDQLEVRPQAQMIVEQMAHNISHYGGCSLIVDYGDVLNDRHTLRAFQSHKLTSPLDEPGNFDLTSNVDFSNLQNIFDKAQVKTFGPVTQHNFLTTMGINVRKQKLMEKATTLQAKDIETAFRMLMDSAQMGDCFKFLTAVGHGITKPAGF